MRCASPKCHAEPVQIALEWGSPYHTLLFSGGAEKRDCSVMTNRFDPSGTMPLKSLAPFPRIVAGAGRYGFRLVASILPLFLICLSAFWYVYHLRRLDAVLDVLQAHYLSVHQSAANRDLLLKNGTDFSINGTLLEILYMGIFVSAELAFVAMALREYGYQVALAERSAIGGLDSQSSGIVHDAQSSSGPRQRHSAAYMNPVRAGCLRRVLKEAAE